MPDVGEGSVRHAASAAADPEVAAGLGEVVPRTLLNGCVKQGCVRLPISWGGFPYLPSLFVFCF